MSTDSRGMARSENVGPEIAASDFILGSGLNRRPPFGVNQHLVVQPEPNQLLCGAGSAPAVLAHLGGESRLASGDIDGALQRGNVGRKVVALHERKSNTKILVIVNKDSGLTDHKETCRVLSMSQTKRKPQPVVTRPAGRKRATALDVGPDGLTLPQRLHRLMAAAGVGQAELARMCSDLYATFVPNSPEKVKQQHIFNLLQGQATAWCLPLVASVFDVSDLWLQFGIGRKERLKN